MRKRKRNNNSSSPPLLQSDQLAGQRAPTRHGQPASFGSARLAGRWWPVSRCQSLWRRARVKLIETRGLRLSLAVAAAAAAANEIERPTKLWRRRKSCWQPPVVQCQPKLGPVNPTGHRWRPDSCRCCWLWRNAESSRLPGYFWWRPHPIAHLAAAAAKEKAHIKSLDSRDANRSNLSLSLSIFRIVIGPLL